MMKVIKPGQIYHPPGLKCNVRAKKRTHGCEGCILDSPYICPEIRTKNRYVEESPCCAINDIIFVKP